MCLAETERIAIAVALDELDSYREALGDLALAQEDQNPEKLRWASRKLHALLKRTEPV